MTDKSGFLAISSKENLYGLERGCRISAKGLHTHISNYMGESLICSFERSVVVKLRLSALEESE